LKLKKIILKIIYFIILTPISFLLKLFGISYINFEIDPEKKSYWNKVDENNRDYKSQY